MLAKLLFSKLDTLKRNGRRAGLLTQTSGLENSVQAIFNIKSSSYAYAESFYRELRNGLRIIKTVETYNGLNHGCQ